MTECSKTTNQNVSVDVKDLVQPATEAVKNATNIQELTKVLKELFAEARKDSDKAEKIVKEALEEQLSAATKRLQAEADAKVQEARIEYENDLAEATKEFEEVTDEWEIRVEKLQKELEESFDIRQELGKQLAIVKEIQYDENMRDVVLSILDVMPATSIEVSGFRGKFVNCLFGVDETVHEAAQRIKNGDVNTNRFVTEVIKRYKTRRGVNK